MEVYLDPDTQHEKVITVVSFTGVATHVHFSLVGSGPGIVLLRKSFI